MRLPVGIALVLALSPNGSAAQGLRQVPQRFAYIQPVGLFLGVGTAGLEFRVGRSTTIEIGGIGVYSVEDGIRMYGGGPGLGIRRYLNPAEAAGPVVGARVDGVWLEADNRDADAGFLAGPLGTRRSHLYLGAGALFGYRWVSTSGLLIEPSLSYEYFVGPRPLVPGSRSLQDELGFALGLAFGWAW